MTAKELAGIINGRAYCNELTKDMEKDASDNGLVVVYGRSDNRMIFVGSIKGKRDCYEGGTAYVTVKGLVEECASNCVHFRAERSKAYPITAVWAPNANLSWEYETEIPHETFEILEGGIPFCRGIVFSISDIEKDRPPAPKQAEYVIDLPCPIYQMVDQKTKFVIQDENGRLVTVRVETSVLN